MAYKTRRQSRYLKLRQYGYLPFEARPLSNVPVSICPYSHEMLKERYGLLRKARRDRITQTQWEQQIKVLYRDSKWLTRNRAGKIIADPWKMLRDFEERWRAKEPQYTSPWQKRHRKWVDFYSKVERTMQLQRGLA